LSFGSSQKSVGTKSGEYGGSPPLGLIIPYSRRFLQIFVVILSSHQLLRFPGGFRAKILYVFLAFPS
jgi:hypothetical protein